MKIEYFLRNNALSCAIYTIYVAEKLIFVLKVEML